MDKSTLSQYGWVVIVIIVIVILLGFATPFGNYLSDNVVATLDSFSDAAGIDVAFGDSFDYSDILSNYNYTPSYSMVTEQGRMLSLTEISPENPTLSISVSRVNYFDISKVPSNSKVTNNGDGTLTVAANVSAINMLVTIAELCPDLKVGDEIWASIETTGRQNIAYQLFNEETGTNKTYDISINTEKPITVTQEMLDGSLLLYGVPSGSEDFAEAHTISNIQFEFTDKRENKESFAPYIEDLSSTVVTVDDGINKTDISVLEGETVNVNIASTKARLSARPDGVKISCEYLKKDKVKVVANGDSITYGYGQDVGPTKSYVKLACDSLGYSLENYALNGKTAAEFPADANNAETVNNSALVNTYTEMLDDADLVFISIGSNDWYYTPIALGSMASRDTTTFYGALHILCAGLKEKYPDTPIIFATPIKRWITSLDTNGEVLGSLNHSGEPLENYCTAIKEVCAYYGIMVMDMYNISGIDTWDEDFRNNYVSDGIHPNAAGHEMMQSAFEKYMNKYFINYFK